MNLHIFNKNLKRRSALIGVGFEGANDIGFFSDAL